MKIEEYIKSEFEERAKVKGCLIIYDNLIKYKVIVDSINVCSVINVTNSTILGREEALEKWTQLENDSNANYFIIYLPINHPEKQEERLKNPYLFFEISGDIFPRGDSDSFLSICHRAFPDKQEAIDKVFANDQNPSFETIDQAVSSDKDWPILRSLLKVESTREILLALLSPSESQMDILNSNKTWIKEAKQFLENSIGLKLLTRSQKWDTIKDEVWRYILFSEFVLDLPEKLPNQLVSIPRAAENYKSIIYSVCESLRENEKYQDIYLKQANKIAEELTLKDYCKNI